jgi:hypothetical protein
MVWINAELDVGAAEKSTWYIFFAPLGAKISGITSVMPLSPEALVTATPVFEVLVTGPMR